MAGRWGAGPAVSWLAHEDLILTLHYPTKGIAFCLALLKGRTAGGIEWRARRLKLRMSQFDRLTVRAETSGVAAPWTEQEAKVVLENYCDSGAIGCLPLLPGRTIDAVRQFAHKRGLAVSALARHQIQTGRHQPAARVVDAGLLAFQMAPFDAVSVAWAMRRPGIIDVQTEGESHG
jgi:hypothetical protein